MEVEDEDQTKEGMKAEAKDTDGEKVEDNEKNIKVEQVEADGLQKQAEKK